MQYIGPTLAEEMLLESSTAIALGTVKSHIARGAARLRELLKTYGNLDEQ